MTPNCECANPVRDEDGYCVECRGQLRYRAMKPDSVGTPMSGNTVSDERLAELIAYCESFNPVTHPQIVEQLSALCELQAYRAKRETHVWVPRSLLTEGVSLCEEIVEECYEYTLEDRPLLGVGVDEYREKLLAASDGNPP